MSHTIGVERMLPSNSSEAEEEARAARRGALVTAETQEDLSHGQIVVIAARWILVVAGLLLALWHPGPIGELKIQILVVLSLAVANFSLHARLLTRRPIWSKLIYAASAGDIAVVTLLILVQGGYGSDLYIFYFPAILALSVSFPTEMTFAFVGATMALYALISLSTGGTADGNGLATVIRVLMLAAAGVCGNIYWRIERQRRRAAREAQGVLGGHTSAQEAAEDVFFGQKVIIWARWSVIVAGVLLALWTATSTSELTASILLVVALMAMNFLLHGRYVMERPANRWLTALVSLLDLAVITALVLTWQGLGGWRSQLFVFYYPVLLAFGFVFPPRLTAAYTLIALAGYATVCVWADPSIIGSVYTVKLVVVRLVTLASMGGLATYYWRIQRDRRRAALGIQASPLGSVLAVGAGLRPAAQPAR